MTNFIQKQIRKQADVQKRAKGRNTTCPNANNPAGHNPACGCGWVARELASQTVPYYSAADWTQHEQPDYPESPHAAL